MEKNKIYNEKEYLKELRQTAEEILKKKNITQEELQNKSLNEMIHEIQVYQIELEMQNDELKRTQTEMELSRNKYSDLYDFAPIGYFTLNVNGIIVDLNFAGSKLLGEDKARIKHKPLTLFIKSDQHSIFYEHLKKTLYSKIKQICEIELINDKGNKIYAQMESLAFTYKEKDKDKGLIEKNQIRTALIDITDRKTAEMGYKEAKEKYEMLFNNINDAVFLRAFENKNSFLEVNEIASKILSYSRKELLSLSPKEIFSEEAIKLLDKIDSNLVHQNQFIYETKMFTKDRRSIPVEINSHLFEFKGKKLVLLIARDITERTQSQQRIKNMMKKLGDSNKELQRFAQIVSHDLKSPLNVVISYINIIRRKYTDLMGDEGKELTKTVMERTENMVNLINDLLDYSRLDKKDTQLRSCDTKKIVGNALQNLEILIEEKNAEITYDTLPPVKANCVLLTSVFQNLISNSLKYSKKDVPPKIEIQVKEYPSSDTDKEYWLFIIKDNGIGIEKKNYESIFQIFNRVNNDSSGYGIGLAYCKKIIEHHKGKIWVESILDEGSTFYFTLEKP